MCLFLTRRRISARKCKLRLIIICNKQAEEEIEIDGHCALNCPYCEEDRCPRIGIGRSGKGGVGAIISITMAIKAEEGRCYVGGGGGQ